jgi:RNA polymerase sigma factor (TIGR02999 family)
VTRLLIEWSRGDVDARDRLLPVVYRQLRRVAGAQMRRERRDHSLQATALVHEAYLRLIDQRQVDWQNQAHFFGIAAAMMRRILVNHARDRAAAKRGGGARRVSLTLADAVFVRAEVDVLTLHDVLQKLADLDLRKSQVVELKFFGGLTTREIAEYLKLSVATVEREWSFARAWLHDALAT